MQVSVGCSASKGDIIARGSAWIAGMAHRAPPAVPFMPPRGSTLRLATAQPGCMRSVCLTVEQQRIALRPDTERGLSSRMHGSRADAGDERDSVVYVEVGNVASDRGTVCHPPPLVLRTSLPIAPSLRHHHLSRHDNDKTRHHYSSPSHYHSTVQVTLFPPFLPRSLWYHSTRRTHNPIASWPRLPSGSHAGPPPRLVAMLVRPPPPPPSHPPDPATRPRVRPWQTQRASYAATRRWRPRHAPRRRQPAPQTMLALPQRRP